MFIIRLIKNHCGALQKNKPMNKIIYPELSYNIMKACFAVYYKLGGGHPESVYQNALAIELKSQNIKFKEQVRTKVVYEGRTVGIGYADFVIEDLIVIEIKKRPQLNFNNILQLEKYLVALKLDLGILIHFGYQRVTSKRVVNKNLIPLRPNITSN